MVYFYAWQHVLQHCKLGYWHGIIRLLVRLEADACWCMCRFVHAQLLNDSSISLTLNMSGGACPRGRDSIPLQLSRHLEMRLADAEGLSDVRHWLQLLGTRLCCPV